MCYYRLSTCLFKFFKLFHQPYKLKWCSLCACKNADLRCNLNIHDFSRSIACSGESLKQVKICYITSGIILSCRLEFVRNKSTFFSMGGTVAPTSFIRYFQTGSYRPAARLICVLYCRSLPTCVPLSESNGPLLSLLVLILYQQLEAIKSIQDDHIFHEFMSVLMRLREDKINMKYFKNTK